MLDITKGVRPAREVQRVRSSIIRPLTPMQKVANQLLAQQTHTCLVGGARSGKTTVIVRKIIQRALAAPNSRHLITRYRANAVRATIYADTFKKVMRTWFPDHATERNREGAEVFKNGAEIWFSGLDESDRVEKILGMEFATVYPGECSQIPYSSILVLRTRLAQPGTGLKLRAYYDLNPTTKSHWTNVEFGEKRDPISRLPLANPQDFARMFINPKDNQANLDPSYLKSLENMPKAYRERFFEGNYVDDVEGALWTISLLESCREERVLPDEGGKKLADFRRIVVGVDPSGAQSKNDIKSDEIGIVTVGKRHKNTATVLEDATMKGSPKDWGRAVVAQYRKWRADSVVAEANYGGEMVRSTIQAVDPNVKVKLVKASRGKVVRAEPIAALYEENKITHAGRMDALEDQYCQFAVEGYMGERSPDRADAAIWAITDLMLGEQSTYTLANIS
jgi:hypothetical protein